MQRKEFVVKSCGEPPMFVLVGDDGKRTLKGQSGTLGRGFADVLSIKEEFVFERGMGSVLLDNQVEARGQLLAVIENPTTGGTIEAYDIFPADTYVGRSILREINKLVATAELAKTCGDQT